MQVQEIPEFHSGRILKQEMMVELSTYLYHLGSLSYQNCADGIISSCTLIAMEDSIVVSPGVTRYEGELYLIRGSQLIHYISTNATWVLNIVFRDQVRMDSFVTREMESAFTEEAFSETHYLEPYRFKLQSDACSRYTYTSFMDRETEHGTPNTIHAPFYGMDRPTPSPEITTHFAQEVLATRVDGTNALFCMMLLSPKESVQMEALEAYIQSRQRANLSCGDSPCLYQGFITCLKQLNGNWQTTSAKHKSWNIMTD